jgi:hypothetical protein
MPQMSESKHTPGPWAIEEVRRVLGAGDFGRAPFRDAELEANARLIAAAPDLLAALVALCDSGPHPDDMTPENLAALKRARAAIAKAGG